MPVAPIIQPILWSYGDALHLHPHPDFLILADECNEYSYEVPVNDSDSKPENANDLKTIHEFWNVHKGFIESRPRGYGYWIWKSYLTLKTLDVLV